MNAGSGPYVRTPVPYLGQIRDVNINPSTLATGDTIIYDNVSGTWENGVGGGGGGTATITGSNDFAVFKNGINGYADPACICRVPGTPGAAIIINPTTKSIGLGINVPTERLEVSGVIKAAGALLTNLQLIPTSAAIGMVSNHPLKLYSNNALTAPNATTVDGIQNNIQSASFKSYAPANFDAADTLDKNSIYKIKLNNGMDLWTGGVFNNQANFSAAGTSFPTGQTVEYQNERPIQFPKIIGQFLTSTNIGGGTSAYTTYFGTTVGANDECIYDPMGMRAFKMASDWAYWGAPSLFRTATAKFIINVKIFLSGDWAGFSTNDSLIIRIEQYRNNVFYTQHELARTTPNSASQRMRFNCERTFLGFVTGGNEEFIANTDYYNIQIENLGSNDFLVSRVNVESEFIFAQ